jgi:HPt (histidine-containing phosphotransfer) domain-containing protein
MSDDKIQVTIDADLEELIPGFLENRNADLTTLQACLDNADYDSIKSTGHSLKGVGGGYGFDRISEIGAELEQAGLNKDTDQIVTLLASYKDYLARIEIVYEE